VSGKNPQLEMVTIIEFMIYWCPDAVKSKMELPVELKEALDILKEAEKASDPNRGNRPG
jgi:hypothetical protein